MKPLPPVPAPETCPQCGQWCAGVTRAEHLRLWGGSETTWRERCQPVDWPLGDVDCGQADETTQTPAVEVAAGRGVRPGQGAGRTLTTTEIAAQALRAAANELDASPWLGYQSAAKWLCARADRIEASHG